MDETMNLTMEEELIADLTAELSVVDEKFNPSLLTVKIKNALREVKKARRYPNYYTEEQIAKDMYNFYTNVREIALNDYNKVGIDTENSHSENGVSATFMERNKLFAGVIPLAR